MSTDAVQAAVSHFWDAFLVALVTWCPPREGWDCGCRDSIPMLGCKLTCFAASTLAEGQSWPFGKTPFYCFC